VLEVVSVERERSYSYVWKVYGIKTKYSNALFKKNTSSTMPSKRIHGMENFSNYMFSAGQK
jgi:hypothetical protein